MDTKDHILNSMQIKNGINFEPINDSKIGVTLTTSKQTISPNNEFEVEVNINGLNTITDGIIVMRRTTRL